MPDLLNGKPVVCIPLRGGRCYDVWPEEVAEIERMCPDVDVPTTLQEILLWCWANQDKLKTRGRVFVRKWMIREQARAMNGDGIRWRLRRE